MAEVVMMKAPKGTTAAQIHGHDYDVPTNGVIKVKNDLHVEELKRHGFHETDDAGEPDFTAMSDKELIDYIEERGGDADDSMKTRKLQRLAREAYADSDKE